MKLRPLLTLLALASGAIAPSLHAETPEETANRLKWWRDGRFGMFIHWSPSSVGGREIGWDRKANRPLEAPGNKGGPVGPTVDPVYDAYYKEFNPTKYDAREWVKLAEDAGMKYMVFTSKHHEGFSMWPTKARDFSIANTPYKNGRGDILRDLADACHASKMRLGWYYSPRDWTHPDYGVGDNSKYEKFMTTQIDELLSNYGKIDLIWWDSFGVGDSYKFWHADKFLKQIRTLQPQILTNNRCSFYVETNRAGLEGDFDTPEHTIGGYQTDRPWESCLTLVGHYWSYRPGAHMLGFNDVIARLVSCATGDGNLLLNVGPMPDGTIEPRQADLLRKVGGWMKQYGESIYSTRGGPFKNGKWGGATFRDKTVYLHVLPNAPDTVTLPKLNETLVSSATLAGNPVQVTQSGDRLRIQLPKDRGDHPVTLVKLTFDQPVTRVTGTPEVTEAALDGLKQIGLDATYTASSLIGQHSKEKDTLLKNGSRGEFAFHTENEKNPYIVIDLKKRLAIDKIAILNRKGYEDRANTLTLSFSDDGQTWTKAWAATKGETQWLAEPGAMVSGAWIKGIEARYLRLETFNETPTALHLRAVKIYGK